MLLPVSERLDTVNPAASRPPGTLVEALGCAHRAWGPRRGARQLCVPHALSTKPTAAPRLVQAGAFTGSVAGAVSPVEQGDLGTEWTLDVLIRVSSLPAGTYPIFQWYPEYAGILAVEIAVYGSGAGADAGKVRVEVVTTSSPGVAAATVTLKSATLPSHGTAEADVHHYRVVRDGKNLYLYIDGVLDATSASLSVTNAHQATSTASEALWRLYPGATFPTAQLWYVVLRSGVYRTAPISRAMPPHVLSKNVKLALVGSRMTTTATLQAKDFLRDLSRWQSHGYATGGWAALTFAQDTSGMLHRPVQGLGSFVGLDGVHGNAVKTAGTLYWRNAQGS